MFTTPDSVNNSKANDYFTAIGGVLVLPQFME